MMHINTIIIIIIFAMADNPSSYNTNNINLKLAIINEAS